MSKRRSLCAPIFVAVLLAGARGVAWGQTGDEKIAEVNRPQTAEAKFLAAHPGATALAADGRGLTFRNANGSQSKVLGAITHRDPQSGAWKVDAPVLSTTANGWRVDGTRFDDLIRKEASGARRTVTQSYTDYTSKHASSLVISLPQLVYDKEMIFGFTSDGVPWKLKFDPTGAFYLTSTVAAKQGKKAYTFNVSSSETLQTDKDGNLAGDAYVRLTRAMMITKQGKRVPCSPWTYTKKDGGAFTCDDSGFRPEWFPYAIDPSSTLTDGGSYFIDNGFGYYGYDESCDCPYWGWYGNADATVTFTTSGIIPLGGTYNGSDCGFSADGDSDYVNCSVPSFNGSGSTAVRLHLDGDEPNFYYRQSTVWDVTLTVSWNDPPQAASPSISPGGGVYVGVAPAITIWTTSPGASIRYTIDGSTPSPTSGTLYSGPFTPNATEPINAIAYGTGYLPSYATLGNIYTLIAGAPTFSIPGGTYSAAQTVALSTATPGASIRYTRDGTAPSATVGTLYSGPISVSSTSVIKAVAYRSGWTSSAISAVSYTIAGPLTGFAYSRQITIDHTKVANTTQSNFPILLSGTYSFLATVAHGGAVQNSNGYDIAFATDAAGANRLDHEIESYDPATGAVNLWIRVPTISATTDTVVYVFYGNPGISSSMGNPTGVWSSGYQGVWHLPNGSVLSANDSSGNQYNGSISGATATAGPIGGGASFAGAGGISIPSSIASSLTANPGLSISAWVNPGTAYGQIYLSNTVRLNVIGCVAGQGMFQFQAGQWVVRSQCMPYNTWHHVTGVYDGDQTRVYLDGVPGTYTYPSVVYQGNITNDFIATGAWPVAALTGALDEVRVSVGAHSADWILTEYRNQSSPSTFYTVGAESALVTSAPTFSPAGGTFASPQTVSLASTTSGASIRYTVDGSTPTSTTGAVYSAPIAVNSTIVIKAIAYVSGRADSTVSSATYTITGTVATPTFTPAAGTYTSGQSVTIATTTSGAAIRYTTDGSTPTSTTGLVYSGPVSVSATATVKAIGYETGWNDSAVASAAYTITGTVATPSFNPTAGTYTSGQSIALTTGPAPAP